MPAGLRDPSRLVEEAAGGAAERQLLVGIDLAPLEPITSNRRLHDVVPTVGVDGHPPILAQFARRPAAPPTAPQVAAVGCGRGPLPPRRPVR